MANKKPSALTAASALDGSELVHCVQAGNSRKATVAQMKSLALAPFGANGLAARTGSETFAARTITGTANEIAVSNGDGVSGNPTLSLPAAMTFTGKTVTGGTFTGITDIALTDGGTGASLSDPGADRILFWDDSAGQVTWLEAGAGLSIGGTAMSVGGGRLIGLQVITAVGPGTYTPTAGTNSIVIEMVGGGGGGGGVVSPGGTNCATSAGGGGGGYLRKRLTTNFAGAAYVVGTGGSGGAAGANAGSSGADTSFTDTSSSPVTYTSEGGGGGLAGISVSVVRVTGSAIGGSAINGDVNIPGASAHRGVNLSTSQAFGGQGGNSVLGHGAIAGAVFAINTSQAGQNGSLYGGGGSGAAAVGTGSAAGGGTGATGALIVYEFS